MVGMTITEFLEARIAEDEAYVRSAGSDLDDCQECGFGHQPESPYGQSRLLAECAAKREIIAFDHNIQIWEPRGFSSDTAVEAFTSGGPQNPHARHVTRILAGAYSDHPDYRQEWAL
jgi:hypothetical protein